jgi:hypothetical protein
MLEKVWTIRMREAVLVSIIWSSHYKSSVYLSHNLLSVIFISPLITINVICHDIKEDLLLS